MTQALALELARKALMEALVLGAPLLGIAVLVGVGISVLQAVTQVQDQTLSFVPKLLAILVALLLCLSWMLQSLVTYTVELFRAIPGLV